MHHCDTWVSSYRLVLAFLEEVDNTPQFAENALAIPKDMTPQETASAALWDVVFARLSTIQEYGWHAGLEELIWVTDTLNGSLSEMNWSKLREELTQYRTKWEDLIISHAKKHGAFFPPSDPSHSFDFDDDPLPEGD
jgi:hypothetical protein